VGQLADEDRVVKQNIRLRGISDEIKGKTWESDALLRAGRLGSLEIVLDDSSVSRRHAELRFASPAGWIVRDLESTNGTYLNGQRLTGERPVRTKDIVQFGKVALMVDLAENGVPVDQPQVVDDIKFEATASASWEDAQQNLVYDKNHTLRPGEQLMALLRAGRHLNNIDKEDELLDAILHDAVHVLDAQRGAIVLADGPDQKLKIRSLANGLTEGQAGRFHYSQKIAQRCFARGESYLCSSVSDDPELATAQSIADGAMSSVLCVLLRTPRRALGVLHLDRTLWQKPFTEEELHLADALAAHVSAGIEAATLLRKQRELFRKTVTVLTQLVEGGDEDTGDHIKRVTTYAVMLGRQIGMKDSDLELLELGTPLHDIGKVAIPDAILKKPGKLTPEEFEIMKTHTTAGAKVLRDVEELAGVIPIVRNHHERWDGTGYPDGLKGEAIPLMARIVSVVDTFDAMTNDRCYSKARPPEAAFTEIQRMSGTQFDPQVAAAFLAIQAQVIEEMRKENQTAVVQKPTRKPQDPTDTPSAGTRPAKPAVDKSAGLSATNRTTIDVGAPPPSNGNGSGSFHAAAK
jgi:putative nucleotidyltransferase with HDIG domain